MLNDLLKRATRDYLMLMLAISLALTAILFFNRHKIHGLLGAEQVAAKDFVANPAKYEGHFVRINGDSAFDTGIQKVKAVSNQFVSQVNAIVVEKRIIPVVTKSLTPSKVVQGLVQRDDGLNLRLVSNASTDLNVSLSEARQIYSPYSINTFTYNKTGVIILLAVAGLPLLLCLRQIVRLLRRLSDISTHPLRVELLKNGATAADFAELDAPNSAQNCSKVGKVTFTHNWMVFRNGPMHAVPSKSISWVYGKVTSKKAYGVVPLGKNFATAIHTDQTNPVLVESKNAQDAEVMLRTIASRSPWALVGYSAELEGTWKNNRESILAEVERQKPKGFTGA
jgi:hypothetical protein